MGLLLKMHILQAGTGECRVFSAQGSQETVCGGAEEFNPAAAS
jgi:hypothetical protein